MSSIQASQETKKYLKEVAPTKEYSLYKRSTLEKVTYWIHTHPTTVKVLEVALAVFGTIVIASAPFTWSAAVLANIGIGLLGLTMILISGVSQKMLGLIAPPSHKMSTHVYTPSQCTGGKLYYEGDVPILSLEAKTPKEAGYAHGYLLGNNLYQVYKRVDFVKHTLEKQPRAKDIPLVMKKIREKIPESYLEEIKGIVEGYNKWLSEQFILTRLKSKPITVEDLLLLHLMPDSLHFDGKSFDEALKTNPEPTDQAPIYDNPSPFAACAAIVAGDKESGPTFARAMDWPSFGIGGTHTLVIRNKDPKTGLKTVRVSPPGFVGVITGMNSHGLSLAMNVCSARANKLYGIPAAFYNRMVLENCQSVKEAEAYTWRKEPLGAYHLTVADANDAATFSFLQGQRTTPFKREWSKDKPLITTNFAFNQKGDPIDDINNSKKRETRIRALFNDAEKTLGKENLNQGLVAAHSLKLPVVNNSLTSHTIVMNPKTLEMQVAFNNAWSSKEKLHKVPTKDLLK